MKLQRWFEQVNYEGLDYSDYFVAAQRFFRSNALERATFQYIREALHGTMDSSWPVPGIPPVIDVTFQDDCLVARYMALVHKDFEKGIKMAEMFMERLLRKGYVDPETAGIHDVDLEDLQSVDRSMPEPPFNAADPSGRYIAIKIDHGAQGGSLTTLSVQKKNRTREREAAARERNAKALADITGTPTSLVARSIDGISRRWKGVRARSNDDHEADPIER